MATPPRLFEDGGYYHIYNRGNKKQQIFLQDRDYERFLEKVVEYRKKYSVKILAYCLMPNHFHFLIQQLSQNTITKFLGDLSNSHSRYFNVKYETVGSLYQGRFKAKKVDKDEYLIHLSRYIHLNPVDLFSFLGKQAVEQLLQYRWSSLPAYITGNSNEIVSIDTVLGYFSKKDPSADYKDFVVSNINLKTDPIISHLVVDE
jgi:REP element-mobilizing transposase RayT